ncbi:CPBP family intramembrane glutamic endopeptidase, partial [Heyndrickxia sporothermodurans]
VLNKKSRIYILYCYAITWSAWGTVILLSHGKISPEQPLYLLYGLGGLLGPVLAAFIAHKFYGPKNEFKQFLQQLVRVKLHYMWFMGIILLPFALSFLPFSMEWSNSGHMGEIFVKPYYTVFLTLPMFIIGGGMEELGWRGTLLPELNKKYSIFTSTLVVTVFWLFWHVPLWFINGTVQFGSNLEIFMISLLTISLLLSAVYIKTRSIFLCVLLHALFNSNGSYFAASNVEATWPEYLTVIIQLFICFIIYYFLVRRNNLFKKIPPIRIKNTD